MRLLSPLLLSFILFISCTGSTTEPPVVQKPISASVEGLEKAYFASGCFWCVEAIYESLTGVEEVISGYAGGHTDNPTYRSIGTGRTGHAETVEVYYNPELIDFATLVNVFYASQDPTTQGQAPDFGHQYRSIIFYQNEAEAAIAKKIKAALQASGEYSDDIVTEIVALERFYTAEDYHQNYEQLHPNDGYIRQVSIPRLKRFQALHPELLKAAAKH